MVERDVKRNIKPTESALKDLEGLFSALPKGVLDTEEGAQRIKTLSDGTEIIIGRYRSTEHGGSAQILDTFTVNVIGKESRAYFVLTPNGLVSVVTGYHSEVTLRSFTSPRPDENLMIHYENGISGTQEEFRKAAEPLVDWVLQMSTRDQFLDCPVSVVEKTN